MEKYVFDSLINKINNKTLTKEECDSLSYLGYVKNGYLTQKAFDDLKPYKVKRAIIMAAGFGSRMVPITLTTPKPLVKVNGVRFIDTLIEKLKKNDIGEIYVVRGYLKEKFDELLVDYPSIKFIDNDLYNKENNISSVMKAISLIENTYICEADFLITGDDVIQKYQYGCNYIGSKVKKTDDWCFDVDENDVIHNYRKGGKNCVQAFGISYWDKENGKKLQHYLEEMYKNESNKQKFWEMCIFEDYKDEFSIKCRYVNFESIQEIDSYDELKEVDSNYK